jgi:hypothetical protein
MNDEFCHFVLVAFIRRIRRGRFSAVEDFGTLSLRFDIPPMERSRDASNLADCGS